MSMESDVKTFLDACEQKPSVENILLYYDLIKEEYTGSGYGKAIINEYSEELRGCP